jgi:hypothetical protein
MAVNRVMMTVDSVIEEAVPLKILHL